MKRLLEIPALLVALLLGTMGVMWLVHPAAVAPRFDWILPEGRGLSSVIGGMSAFGVTIAFCIVCGLLTRNRTWFYPAISLLSITAFGRIVSTVHGAPLVLDRIVPEIIMALLVFLGSRIVVKER